MRLLCCSQSVASKGEPFLSAFEPTAAALGDALTPHGLALTELLGPRSVASMAHHISSSQHSLCRTKSGNIGAVAVLFCAGCALVFAFTSPTCRAPAVERLLTCCMVDCREMVAEHLPHLTWDDDLPPICSFYSYATVLPKEAAAQAAACAPAELVAPQVLH